MQADSIPAEPQGSQLDLSESESEVAQSCLTVCDPKACSLPGFSVRGISQARIPEWVTIGFKAHPKSRIISSQDSQLIISARPYFQNRAYSKVPGRHEFGGRHYSTHLIQYVLSCADFFFNIIL